MFTKGLFLFRKRQREAVDYAIRPGGEDFRVVAVESNRRWEWGVNVRRSAAWVGATLITADGKHNMSITFAPSLTYCRAPPAHTRDKP